MMQTTLIRWTVCTVMNVIFLTIITGYNIDTKYPMLFNSTADNYFGYSVALLRNREGPTALVTAPRANSSVLRDLYQPGVLFSCKISFLKPTPICQEVVLDTKGNTFTGDGDNSYRDKKDNMWLGVSLDVQQKAANKHVVTCGHLWKNQYYSKHYLANGVCYVINSDLDPKSVKKLVPLVNKSNQSIIPPGIYYYAFGQAGTSAAFSEDGKYLLLGAPGVYDWSGTVLSYKSPVIDAEGYRHPVIPNPPGDLSPESYIGYSVSSGNFFEERETYIAVGAPRDKNSHGRVFIIKALTPTSDKFNVYLKKEGTQFGEYFGAAVMGIDLNNDNYTDLLVGAPFSSTESGGDEGKVYVYISNGMGLQAFAEISGGNKPNSRFGTCIASIGDMNQDGFNDVAIGAPYEDTNGAVYIYHGTTAGLNIQYVQRISAAELAPSLSGFGISISHGVDIDNNYYPGAALLCTMCINSLTAFVLQSHMLKDVHAHTDTAKRGGCACSCLFYPPVALLFTKNLLIGSYASSQAVLLRTFPVIQLSAKIDFNPQQINTNVTSCEFHGKNVTCLDVTTCVHYTGKHSQLLLNFETELFIDSGRQNSISSSRGYFVVNNSGTSVIRRQLTLEIGKDDCSTDKVYIHADTKDVITPIEFLFNYRLVNYMNGNTFCKICPVIDSKSVTNITKAISFHTGCDKENKCWSDLFVKGQIVGNPRNEPLIIGKNSTLTVDIQVTNNGEPAYLAELFIYLPSETLNVNQDFCAVLTDQQKQETNASLQCDLGNPLKKGKWVNIQIKIDVSKLSTNKEVVKIFLEAKTASSEMSPANNELTIPIRFKAVADVSITGTAEHEQIPYNELDEEPFPFSISHTYFIMNHGPSPLQVIDIELQIPTDLKGNNGLVHFLSFTNLEADSGKPLTIPAKCNTSIELKPIEPDIKKNKDVFGEGDLIAQGGNDTTMPLNLKTNSSQKLESSEVHISSRSKKSVNENTSSTKKRKDITINCQTAHCMIIQCSASPFLDNRKFARIAVSAQINLTVLNENLDPWYRIEFVTSGKISIRGVKENIQPKHHHPDETSVKTILVHSGPPPSQEVEKWIIFVSTGIGILLLIIILITLIKIGFFKRQQKDQMREMMMQADLKEWEPYLIADETDASDGETPNST